MTRTIWTKDLVNDLKLLVRSKYSASEIGTIMGISKNAVSGKCWRLGIVLKGRSGRPANEIRRAA